VLEVDKEQPAVVVRGDERGVEVGISYGGQLLLDYRPAARQAKEQAAEIIGSHWNRLQRYCDRYVRVGGGQLSSVFVSGEQGLVDMVERGLASSKLEVRPLSASAIDARWEMSSSAAAGEFAAAIGAALLGTKAGQQQFFVNLIDRRRAHGHAALGPALAKALWPAAAMLLVSLGAFGAMQYQRLQRNALDAELALLEPQRSEARLLRMRAMNDQHDIEQLTRIGEHVHSLAWNELAATISQCLPEDVWLDDMKVDGQGRLQLVGASFTEDGVFEFVRWLEQVPMLEHVALSGTRPTHLGIGPATQFDVRCDFTGKSDREARHDKS
jgi:Tfp pilus assembly protein PilN